jgi:cell wall-associated NlpC family hydrolase
MRTWIAAGFVIMMLSCNTDLDHKRISANDSVYIITKADSAAIQPVAMREPPPVDSTVVETGISTRSVTPDELIRFAESLMGTPYVYGSSDPQKGFDCSGFITHVFSHFNIEVPRSSIDFTNVGTTVDIPEARRGDIILFTGTGEFDTDVGHMGLVVSNTAAEGLHFIHSTSGKAMGVTITPLNEGYRRRFVRVSRIFE